MANETNATPKDEKKQKKEKKGDNAFVRFFKRIGKWFKDTGAELKKVTWPSFSSVVKSTSIVLGVVACFLVVLMLFDVGVGKLYELLVKGVSSGIETETTSSLLMSLMR